MIKLTGNMQEYMDAMNWCKLKGLKFTKENAQEMLELYRNRDKLDRTSNSRRDIK